MFTKSIDIIKRLNGLGESTTDKGVADVLLQAGEAFGTKLVFATSLGAEDQVLTELIARYALPIRIFTLDTGRLPQETYETIEQIRQRYNIHIEMLSPEKAEVEKIVNEHGPNLFYKSVELRKLCCTVRKVHVLRRKLRDFDAWICGLRAEQSVTRSQLKIAEWDEANGLIKLCPLANWSTEQVWQYIREHNVPYNKLHDAGYPSIGCAPCTRAIKEGEDLRAGRWWWEQPEHKECGLHWHKDVKEHK
ncbi:MAG: phosphoadenylyl-sulfate reductase [Sedimentisphaerales bacterium]|nr:phosphoadenylyl-sulfate reductase [Sedimentisphaerales bacterium]